MAFERNNFLVARKISLPASELSVECNLSAGASVSKILAVTADACMGGHEVMTGVVNYTGYIDTKVVFLTDDGQINTVCASCPFSSKFDNEKISNGQIAYINLQVVDFSNEILSGENIRIVATLEQSGFVVGNKEVSTIKCEGDDVCSKMEEIEVVKFVGFASDSEIVESEISLRDNIKKVILTESNAVVKNVEAGVGFVSISGDVCTRVLYLSENDKFESGYVYDTFKQEVELVGVGRDSLVEGNVCVKQDGVITEIVYDERGAKIMIKAPLKMNVYAFEKNAISVVQDLYGTKNKINIAFESFEMTSLCPVDVVDGKIEGSLILDDDKPRVDKILFSGGNSVVITNKYLQDDEIVIEGIARTNVVYLNDEDSSLYSVGLDVPFTIADKFVCEEGVLDVNAIICDSDVVVKKGRELIFDAKIKVSVGCCHDLLSGVISQAVIDEEYAERNYAMEVVFAQKGKSLWDVAKAARVKEEQILFQNPDVAFPIVEDCPLVLFYQRVQ